MSLLEQYYISLQCVKLLQYFASLHGGIKALYVVGEYLERSDRRRGIRHGETIGVILSVCESHLTSLSLADRKRPQWHGGFDLCYGKREIQRVPVTEEEGGRWGRGKGKEE